MGRFQEGAEGVGLSPHIKNLRPVHRSMAMAVALGNNRPGELSVVYGYTPGQVSRIMGSPAFQAEVARLAREKEIVSMDMAKDIQMMTQKAVEILDADLEVDPETIDLRKLRQNAALEVLNIAGVRKSGGAGGVNIFQFNDNRSVNVADLDEESLREEIVNLSKGKSGTYGN